MRMALYGYVSVKAINAHCGTSLYSTPDGGEVEVSAVGQSPDPKEGQYNWDDAVCVGEVVHHIRHLQLSRNQMEMGIRIQDAFPDVFKGSLRPFPKYPLSPKEKKA